MAPACHCFSLCRASEVGTFLHAIPATVHDESSPWIGYLAAVYTERPPLPVSLSNFTFFYHRDRYWPTGVEWPMAACPADGKPPRSHSCSQNVCSRWRVRDPSQQSVLATLNHQAQFDLTLVPNDVGTSRGAIVVRRTQWNGAFIAHDIDITKAAWVEVIRWHSRLGEGIDGFGCWFQCWFGAGAIGSGIWLYTGRTAIECMAHGATLRKKGERSAMHTAWTRNEVVDHGEAANEATSKLLQPLGRSAVLSASIRGTDAAALFNLDYQRETVPYYAQALGYETVQCPHGWNGLTELVALHAVCMNGSRPLLGCAPEGLDLRSGWAHQKPCTCHEPALANLTSLTQVPPQNCRGVARSDMWPGARSPV
jgi:hypothetical protein